MFTLLSAKRYCGHKYRCGDMLQFQIMTSGIISGDQAAVESGGIGFGFLRTIVVYACI